MSLYRAVPLASRLADATGLLLRHISHASVPQIGQEACAKAPLLHEPALAATNDSGVGTPWRLPRIRPIPAYKGHTPPNRDSDGLRGRARQWPGGGGHVSQPHFTAHLPATAHRVGSASAHVKIPFLGSVALAV